MKSKEEILAELYEPGDDGGYDLPYILAAMEAYASHILADAFDQKWLPIESCNPVHGMKAWVAFDDGFYSIAEYYHHNHDGETPDDDFVYWKIQTDNHDIAKWYGNRIEPILWCKHIQYPNPPAPPKIAK